MNYAPRSGSAGDRALQQLRMHAGPMPQRDLADAIDVDSKNLQNNIVMCLQHGLIQRQVVDGVPHYTLGDGTPPTADVNETPTSEAGGSDVANEGTGAKPGPGKPKTPARPPVVPRERQARVAPPAPASAPEIQPAAECAASFSCAQTSDGRLLIELGPVLLTLSAAQAAELWRYGDRLGAAA